jgi:crotonobetainyl-CoA:carnitine CoA-transferase CaiB-like acyl-CoA transferase
MDLDSVQVIDLSRLAPGPYGSQLLSDLGAEIIRVESPGIGDYLRATGPQTDRGISSGFNAINSGKKSIAIDLKTQKGKEVFFNIVEDADVVIEQFRPGVVERLGVDYNSVKEYNPDIIYCSITGYGQSGPYRDRVGHDLNYIGFSGLLDVTRPDKDEPPTIPGYTIADMAGGVFAGFSIMGALLDREINGSGGEYIDISMTEAVLSFSHQISSLAAMGKNPRPGETLLTGEFPCYDVYETKDSRFVTLAAIEPEFWENFCKAVDRPELIDQHRADDSAVREAVRKEVEDVFKEKTQIEWEEELGNREVMFGLVRTPAETINDPQHESRDIFTTDGSSQAARVRYPAKFSSGLSLQGEAPRLGEHTKEILLSQGLSEDDIEELHQANVIKMDD